MAVYETERDRIVLRVVYDGAGLVGKTTNLEQLAAAFDGKYVPDPPEDDPANAPPTRRTRFFDWFMFDGGKLDGHGLRIQVVSVPGNKRFEARRARLLRSADAIVLVCDSDPAGLPSAREALDSQREHLGSLASEIPLVVQANKQDLADALQPQEVATTLGLPLEVPVLAAQTSAGIGVRETVVQAVRTAVRRIKRQITRGGLASLAGTAANAATLRADLARLSPYAEPEDAPNDPTARPRRRPAQRLTIVNEPRVVQMRAAKASKFGTRTPVGEPLNFPPARPEVTAPRPAEPPKPALFFDEEPAHRPPPPAVNTPPSERVTLPESPADPPTLPSEGELSPATLHALVELATAQPATPPRPPSAPSPRAAPQPAATDLSKKPASSPPAPAATDLSKKPAPPARPASRPARRIPSAPEIPMTPAADPSGKPPRRPRTRPQLIIPRAEPVVSGPVVLPPPSRARKTPKPTEPTQPEQSEQPVLPISQPATPPIPAAAATPAPTPAPDAPTPRAPVARTAPFTSTTRSPAALSSTATSTPRPTTTPTTAPAPSSPGTATAASPRSPDKAPAPTSVASTTPVAPTTSSAPPAAPAPVPEPAESLPPLPRPDVPTGHVWPIPRGREILRELIDLPVERLPAPPRQSDRPLLLSAGTWRLYTGDTLLYPDLETAHAALLERVRQTRRCAPLLARDLALVVRPEGEAARLWHIVPHLDGVREHLALRPVQARPRLLAMLASVVIAALRLWLRHGVALELDLGSFAVEAGRIVHLGDRIDARPRDPGVALLGLCERLSSDVAALAAFTAALEQELAELTTEERARLELEAALVRAETRYQDAHAARNRLLAALRAPT